MRPYNVEIFTQDFEMVGNTNVNEITYKEDYPNLPQLLYIGFKLIPQIPYKIGV